VLLVTLLTGTSAQRWIDVGRRRSLMIAPSFVTSQPTVVVATLGARCLQEELKLGLSHG
jgi:hypothetical protein